MEVGLYFEGGLYHGRTTDSGGGLEALVEVRVPTPRCLVAVYAGDFKGMPFEMLTYYATDSFKDGRQVVVHYLNSPRLQGTFEI